MLCTLVHNRGRLLTHDTMLRKVWGAACAEDRQTLRVRLPNLRRKLGLCSASGAIRTYPGVGYLFDTDADARPPVFGDQSQSRRAPRAA